MPDQACVGFLQWCLPRLALRWPGYAKVRGTVCKRLRRRQRELGLAGFDAYRDYIETDPEEWARIDAYCRIPISRFWRDSGVFQALGQEIVPVLAARAVARGADRLRLWSAGAASGEEAYTLALLWRLELASHYPELALDIVATEVDEVMLARAERAVYRDSSLSRLPEGWRQAGFERLGENFRMKETFRAGVRFLIQDIRREMPAGPFDLVACRNLVFTYFAVPLQARLLEAMTARLAPGGVLLIGSHERLPDTDTPLIRAAGSLPIFRKAEREEPS